MKTKLFPGACICMALVFTILTSCRKSVITSLDSGNKAALRSVIKPNPDSLPTDKRMIEYNIRFKRGVETYKAYLKTLSNKQKDEFIKQIQQKNDTANKKFATFLGRSKFKDHTNNVLILVTLSQQLQKDYGGKLVGQYRVESIKSSLHSLHNADFSFSECTSAYLMCLHSAENNYWDQIAQCGQLGNACYDIGQDYWGCFDQYTTCISDANRFAMVTSAYCLDEYEACVTTGRFLNSETGAFRH